MLPLDLHVLGLSLAFILSQDQTLRCLYIVFSFLKKFKTKLFLFVLPSQYIQVFSCSFTLKELTWACALVLLCLLQLFQCPFCLSRLFVGGKLCKGTTFFIPDKIFINFFWFLFFRSSRAWLLSPLDVCRYSLPLKSECKGSNFLQNSKINLRLFQRKFQSSIFIPLYTTILW